MKWIQLTFNFDFKPLKKITNFFLSAKEFQALEDKKRAEKEIIFQDKLKEFHSMVDRISVGYSNLEKVLSKMPCI